MKKYIVFFIVALSLLTLDAEAKRRRYSYYDKGYWGNVEMLAGTMLSGGTDIGFSTTHGYCLGHGVAMGLGLGLYVDASELYYVASLPVFLETKYSPLKSAHSPFVSLRTGFSVNDYGNTGFYLSPAIGLNLNRFSIFMRYGLNSYPISADIDIDIDIDMPGGHVEFKAPATLNAHTLSIGFAVNF